LFIEEFNVNELLNDVADTFMPLVEKNQSVLDIQVSDEIAQMQNDITKLRQNLFNLLSNAVKFSKESTISLSVFCDRGSAGDLIVFEVQDQGIGMTEEQLESIFEPFTQADSSTSKRFGGTGLGLTITREFSRLMGGDVTVDSRIGEGTTFTMKVLGNANLG
jgi:signal transduction histidine kinase